MIAISASMWVQGKNRNDSEVLSNLASGWNNARLPNQEVNFDYSGEKISIKYKRNRDNTFSVSDGKKVIIHSWAPNFIDIEIDNSRLRSKITYEKDLILINTKSGDVLFKILPKFSVREEKAPEGSLTAPMPGKVVEIKIKKGSKIKKGDTLLILEAMKMEHQVLAPNNGKVSDILVSKNQQVENGEPLVILD